MALIFIAIQAPAKEPKKGYRGFVDLSGDAIFEKKHSNDRDIVFSVSGITTTHGYQFNKNFFVGGGFGATLVTYNYDYKNLTVEFPVYASGRADWKIGKVPLFADLRLGTSINVKNDNLGHLFITPSIGYRCSWGHRVSLNIGAGVSARRFGHDYHFSEWEFMPSVKIGIEFN